MKVNIPDRVLKEITEFAAKHNVDILIDLQSKREVSPKNGDTSVFCVSTHRASFQVYIAFFQRTSSVG